jgi:Protein of unknown function (DUF3551)
MRPMIYAAAAAAAMFINISAGQASEGPWCSSFNLGFGEVQNCSYRSLPQCAHEVRAGNRGTCFPNPNFGGSNGYGRGSYDGYARGRRSNY